MNAPPKPTAAHQVTWGLVILGFFIFAVIQITRPKKPLDMTPPPLPTYAAASNAIVSALAMCRADITNTTNADELLRLHGIENTLSNALLKLH